MLSAAVQAAVRTRLPRRGFAPPPLRTADLRRNDKTRATSPHSAPLRFATGRFAGSPLRRPRHGVLCSSLASFVSFVFRFCRPPARWRYKAIRPSVSQTLLSFYAYGRPRSRYEGPKSRRCAYSGMRDRHYSTIAGKPLFSGRNPD